MRVPLVLLLSCPALADVLDVRGPNPDFQEIAPAVAAARDGDVLRVWPGTYPGFTVRDKSLSIVRATPGGAVKIAGTVRIQDLAATRRVELTGVSAAGSDGPGLIVSACAGSVRIREGVFAGADDDGLGWPFSGWPGARVLDCADVELTYSSATGGAPAHGEDGGSGANGLEAQNSQLSVFASTISGSGGSTDDDPGASGYDGGHGLAATGSGRLFVSGCALTGGDGGPADYDVDWWTGEYGHGGDGGWGHFGNTPAWLLDCSFDPGAGGWSPDPGHLGSDGQDSAGGTLLPGRARILRTSGLTSDQDGLTIRAEGTPGDEVYLLTSPGPDYRWHPVRGPFLVEVPTAPAAPAWRYLGRIDSTGVLLTALPLADLPPLGHLTPHFQGTFMRGKNYFGSSSWTVVLDAGW